MNSILKVLEKSFIEISNIIRNNDSNVLFEVISKYNLSGDNVKKLDIISNQILKENLLKLDMIKTIGSEEENELIFTDNINGKYMICFDPLDGSSNIDVNITVGTIFAIYEYSNGKIQNGYNIKMAGYCLYAGSTQMIIADSKVNIYQLDNSTNEFKILFEDWKIPVNGPYYAINESNKFIMDEKYNKFINNVIDLGYSARWVGSLVADAHRTLIKGGFFAYPGNLKNKNGKIRLLYEAYPFAYIFKIAGGESSDGTNNLLDVSFPENIHQKTPIILSSKKEFNIFNLI